MATINPEISVAEYIKAFLICATRPTQVDRVQGWGVLHLLIQGPRLTKVPPLRTSLVAVAGEKNSMEDPSLLSRAPAWK